MVALERAALKACLAAMKDDTDAVELCAKLSRKLHLMKTLMAEGKLL
eukprot:CAMPEP_0197656924 /NCGR_PEP_ID=MMETSP1338-20131121/43982_1 /TAXON_ID=43686 ORGANISM="Pelagodinium beii, Strain RCC1491" /NCGR_SAMPLE_ID=MMETSP1338 /ASSEMBLY_ACC=CAM_ASM_000754 /LENGTH=46 /DNA_ID= /DNA_START= /DNA_END= /DNA_ORIENTATION=